MYKLWRITLFQSAILGIWELISYHELQAPIDVFFSNRLKSIVKKKIKIQTLILMC